MRNRYFKAIAFVIILAFPLPLFCGLEQFLQIPAPRPDLKIDFSGEVLQYEASWMGIKSVEAQLKVQPVEGHYRISGSGQTVGAARYLYKADDAVVSETTRDFTPLYYSLQIREPRFSHDRVMTIDRKTNIASSKLVPVGSGSAKMKSFEFHQGFDPVSLFYLIRSVDWKPGMKKYFEELDGRDRSLLLVEALKYETITTRAGQFRTIRLRPYLFNLPKKTSRETTELITQVRNKQSTPGIASWVYLWLALDGTRPVVLARADSFLGSVSLELVSLTPRTCGTGPAGTEK